MKNIKFIMAITAVILAGLYLIKILDISYPIHIVTTTRSTELSVVGEGKVEVTPDTAFVDSGITVNDVPTVDNAQKKIDSVNNKIVASLRDLGIEKGNIKTSNYSINPNYSYERGDNRITGYNGNATITVKVKNLSLLSKIIETVTTAGANQINGVRFTVEEPAKFREQARDKAIASAKEQASKLAKTTGITLGKIINVVESSQGGQPVPVYDMSLKSREAGSAVEIEPGSQTISSVVMVYFEKK